jgi:hypothetical protein
MPELGFSLKGASEMELDYERAAQKRKELEGEVSKAVLDYWQGNDQQGDTSEAHLIAAKIIVNLADIDPPEKEDSGYISLFILKPGGGGGGRSFKPGNVRLNIQKLMHAVAGGAVSVMTAVDRPWLIPFVAIRTFNDLCTSLEVKITERDAAVLWTIWKHCDGSGFVAEDDLLNNVNSELADYGRNRISQMELDDSLTTLTKISTIERSASIIGKWKLTEGVLVNY